MKVFINNPNESWVVDRFRKEFKEQHPDKTVEYLTECDIIWIIAPWQWAYIPQQLLETKKVVCTIHHIVPEKFNETKVEEFLYRDRFVDAYHVPCEKTKNQISKYTKNKPVLVSPFWVNGNLWKHLENKKTLRQKYNLPEKAYLIGSFQRDTEGHDLKSPKLEKGPDLFCDAVEKFNSNVADVQVVLAGWRRQYVMNRLEKSGIPYHYTELPPFEAVNELYNCLDMYIVSSRHEGGPQAIFECALTETPIISTRVGASEYILSESSIYEPGSELTASPDVEYAAKQVKKYNIPLGMDPFITFFRGI